MNFILPLSYNKILSLICSLETSIKAQEKSLRSYELSKDEIWCGIIKKQIQFEKDLINELRELYRNETP